MLIREDAIREEHEVKNGNRYYYCIFECVVCEKEIKVQRQGLKKHSGKCSRCTQLKTMPYESIYNELKTHKKYGVTVEITFEEFLEIIEPRKCHYCGKELFYSERTREWGKVNSRAHQLDRKNNSIGYRKDNLVCCCWDCNRVKSDRFTYEEFLQLAPILKKIMDDRITNGVIMNINSH